MKKSDLPPCHVEYYKGIYMHTHKVNFADKATWNYVGCNESLIENDVLYKVWLTVGSAADPSNSSTTTTVYHFEKVPQEIIDLKKRVDDYWNSNEPMNV